MSLSGSIMAARKGASMARMLALFQLLFNKSEKSCTCLCPDCRSGEHCHV